MAYEDRVKRCAQQIDIISIKEAFERGELPSSICLRLCASEFVFRDAVDICLQKAELDMTYWEFFAACRASGLQRLNDSLWELATEKNIKAIEMLQKTLYIPDMHDVKKPEKVEQMDISDYVAALGSEEAAQKFMQDAIKIDQLREEKKKMKLK